MQLLMATGGKYSSLFVGQNADMEWKFTRASNWINYFDDRNAIPIPLNLVPSVHTIVKSVTWMRKLCCRAKSRFRGKERDTKTLKLM